MELGFGLGLGIRVGVRIRVRNRVRVRVRVVYGLAEVGFVDEVDRGQDRGDIGRDDRIVTLACLVRGRVRARG